MSESKKKKPPTYAFYPRGQGSLCNVLQLRRVEGGALVPADELQLYQALESIRTPFYRIKIAKGSILILAADAVKYMLASGTVKPLVEAPQLLWKQGKDADDSKGIG